jgi:hypothetical protein
MSELNDDIYSEFGKVEYQFGYSTNGYIVIVTFGDTTSWNIKNNNR